MLARRAFAALIVLSLFLVAGANLSLAADLSIQCGVGYDLLSQEYFEGSESSLVEDTLEAWSRHIEYVSSLKGLVNLTYKPLKGRKLELRGNYEQADDFWKTRAYGDFRPSFGPWQLDISGNLETRSVTDDSTDFGDSYWRMDLRTKLKRPVSSSMKAYVQGRAEKVDFATGSQLSYDYSLLSGKLGFEKTLANFSYLQADFSLSKRKVPTSSDLDYIAECLNLYFTGLYPTGEFDVTVSATNKDYNQPENEGDYRLLQLDGRSKLYLASSVFAKPMLELDQTYFDPDDSINGNYGRRELALLAGFETDLLSLAVGPQAEQFSRDGSDELLNETYLEVGGRLDFSIQTDFKKAVQLFSILDGEAGRRDYEYPGEFLSDFYFQRLDLIGTLFLGPNLTFNLLTSVEWEWHESEQDNSSLYLISSSLTYTF